MQRQAVKFRLVIWGALGVIACALLAAAASGQGSAVITKLHDSRYCEIIELKGDPPNTKAVVWNTIGLNDCPAGWWDGLDAATIAADRGDKLVIKNGPRYWTMNSVSGKIGRKLNFYGQDLRRVAVIPIRTAADLSTAPYGEREVDRTNVWHWRKGRTVFRLHAPDGSDYVMQAYSQIVDPKLSEADLPGLADRLALPEGWSYDSKKLKKPLNLGAKGSATVVQDDLRNTYQLLPAVGNGSGHR